MNAPTTNACISCGQRLDSVVAGDQCLGCLLELAAQVDDDSQSLDHAGDDGGDGKFLRQGVLPRFGDYVLHEEIARGGMGVVYRGEQISLRRPVAVKMILAGHLAPPELVRRFHIEAEAAARLHHPGIVPIYQVGEQQTQLYYSMKLIEGTNLQRRLKDFALPLKCSAMEARRHQRRIAELIASVADALGFAHQHGVLHRDVKPSNILIDSQGLPYLTDFGLAKLMAHEASGLTLSSSVLGSPSYMSPEQALGDQDQLTTATDVYALGAVLYELLCGRPPFVANTALQTIQLVTSEPPVRPRSINPAIDGDLETIALRCLEKQPHQRYATALQVRDELQRFLRGEPIEARPLGAVSRFRRWCARNRMLSAATAIVLFTLLVGSAGVVWQWRRAEAANEVLTSTVSHLQWSEIVGLAEGGSERLALAKLARIAHDHPTHWPAASYAISILQQTRFPLPTGPAIEHPPRAELKHFAVSSDGSLIASASVDGSARLWDVDTGQAVGPALSHGGFVNHVAFDDADQRLATASADGTARLWRIPDGQSLAVLEHPQAVQQLFFGGDQTLVTQAGNDVFCWDTRMPGSPSHVIRHGGVLAAVQIAGNDRLMTLGRDGKIQIWSLRSGQLVARLDQHRYAAAAFSPDATRVATWRHGFETIDVWDVESGKRITQTQVGGDAVKNPVFSPAGDRIATPALHHVWVRLWDANTGLPVSGPLNHSEKITSLEFCEDGKKLLTVSANNAARLWDVRNGTRACVPIQLPLGVRSAHISSDGSTIVTAANSKSRSDGAIHTLHAWRIHDLLIPPDRSINPNHRVLSAVATTDDGRWIASSAEWHIEQQGKLHRVAVVETDSAKQVCPPLAMKSDVYGLAFADDASLLLTAKASGRLSAFSLPEGKLLWGPHALTGRIPSLRLSYNQHYAATGDSGGAVTLWDVRTGDRLWTSQHSDARITCVRFSADDRLLVTSSLDSSVAIWDANNGKRMAAIRGHRESVYETGFSSDSRHLLTASNDGTARLWELASGREVHRFRHQNYVHDVRFSPDGRFIATASRDRTVTLWDAASGQQHGRLMRHDRPVNFVDFSHDGKLLLTIDQAGLRFWDVETTEPLTVKFRHPMQSSVGVHGDGMRPTVLSDGNGIMVGAGSSAARVWPMPIRNEQIPSWLPELLEAVAMRRIDKQDAAPEPLPPDQFLRVRAAVIAGPPSNDYHRWALDWLSPTSGRQSADPQ